MTVIRQYELMYSVFILNTYLTQNCHAKSLFVTFCRVFLCVSFFLRVAAVTYFFMQLNFQLIVSITRQGTNKVLGLSQPFF